MCIFFNIAIDVSLFMALVSFVGLLSLLKDMLHPGPESRYRKQQFGKRWPLYVAAVPLASALSALIVYLWPSGCEVIIGY